MPLDFVHDQLLNGRKIRVLTVIDPWSRERVQLEVYYTISGMSVVAMFERLAKRRPLPKMITADNGSEFTSKAMDE